MVGFGSSLRLARRSGWEGGYLDYETLKLLLSQIEAVYEEGEDQVRYYHQQDPFQSQQQQQQHNDYSDNHHLPSRRRRNRRRHPDHGSSSNLLVGRGRRDYRDDIFLASDSDEAFAASDDGGGGGLAQNYSHDETLSDDEDTQDDDQNHPHVARLSADDEHEPHTHYSTTAGTVGAVYAQDAFYVEGLSRDGDLDEPAYFIETSSLLGSAASPGYASGQQAYSYGVDQNRRDHLTLTPPRSQMYPRIPLSAQDTMKLTSSFDSAGKPSSLSLQQPTLSPLPSAAATTTTLPPHPRHHVAAGSASTNAQKANCRRCFCPKRQRRQRRRRLRLVRRQRLEARDRKVPPYIRIAHSRAREIAERFLGKLRAETEKVLLFAQARLGELSDTVGSLRFPSDETADERRGFDYPLAEGGMHPSSSSSDDEFLPRRGHHTVNGYSWSDDSDSDAERDVKSSQPWLLSTIGTHATSDDGTSSRAGLNTHSSRQSHPLSTVLSTARRQIAHYAEIRKGRQTFQRNDHILGEDLLFLSAVEEADGFTAVGVELLHVLRFIATNLIAVRKICRRHDRLLMNRMLGGYYHRMKRGLGDGSDLSGVRTLGGLLVQSTTDFHEVHPALIGQMNHFKLVGVYDKKIQKLANSRTVQVISSCLALALSEYEVSRSRAHALTKLNSAHNSKAPRSGSRSGFGLGAHQERNILQPVLESDDEESGGPPSTASRMSLTRLRFTVTSIFAVREATRFKISYCDAYLSRSLIAFTGCPIIGEGLDGCSRETLDFLIAYNPDSALLLDCSVLYRGLKDGQWMHRPVSEVMIAALATGALPETIPPGATVTSQIALEEKVVSNVLCISPESNTHLVKQLLKGKLPKQCEHRSQRGAELPDIVLRLNRIPSFLYMMNYFLAHATTNLFVRSAGSAPAHTSSIIGSPNLSATLMTIFHCWVLSRNHATHRDFSRNVGLYRILFLLSAFFGMVGNAVHATGVIKNSVALAALGRFFLGFSTAEILQRRILGWCLPSYVVFEATRLVQLRVGGMVAGLFLGAVAEAVPITIYSIGVRSIQATSWLMMFLWFAHFFRLCVQFRASQQPRIPESGVLISGGDGQADASDQDVAVGTSSGDYESDSSDSGEVETPAALMYRSASDAASVDALTLCYGRRGPENQNSKYRPAVTDPTLPAPPSKVDGRTKSSSLFRGMKLFVDRTKKLFLHHIGIPVSFLLHMYLSIGLEATFTATPMITSRYFGWSGGRAATFLGVLAAAILPVNFVGEWISRRYEERTVIKRSLQLLAFGFFILINWFSLVSVATRVSGLFADTEGRGPQIYDWGFGAIPFVVGTTIAFVGLTATEGANLSLLSKVSPAARVRGTSVSSAIGVGSIVTVLTFASRFAADSNILLVDLSHKLINTDLVNSLVIPLFLVSFVFLYVIRKHYFFLL